MPVLDGNFEAFVTNLGKYNEGMLVGEWVKLPTTEEEMQKVLVHAYAEFDWYRSTTLLERRSCNFQVDYESSENITFTNLAKPQGATALYMQVYFEGKLMCYMCWQLSDSALL